MPPYRTILSNEEPLLRYQVRCRRHCVAVRLSCKVGLTTETQHHPPIILHVMCWVALGLTQPTDYFTIKLIQYGLIKYQ